MSEKRKCCVLVFRDGHFRGRDCAVAGKVQRDGKWYCGRHDPVAVKAKKAAQKAKDDARFNAKRKAWADADARAAARAAVISAAQKVGRRNLEFFASIVDTEPVTVANINALRDALAALAKLEGKP